MASYHVDLRVEVSSVTGITIFRNESKIGRLWKRIWQMQTIDATILYDELPRRIGHCVMNALNDAIPDSAFS